MRKIRTSTIYDNLEVKTDHAHEDMARMDMTMDVGELLRPPATTSSPWLVFVLKKGPR